MDYCPGCFLVVERHDPHRRVRGGLTFHAHCIAPWVRRMSARTTVRH